MKRIILYTITAFILIFTGQAMAGDWKRLGERTVNKSRDYDEIHVNDFKKYDYIKLKVRNTGVEFRNVTVVFGNGERFKIPVRKFIPKNGETIAWGLPRGDRFIRKIVMNYKTRYGADERAKVTVYGKRS
ncbi:hypothetical protein [Oleidesulfovibrio sp.]|uniref:DUF2541 family protein n=1 Tax=Oleidesulfovibrio sp. TaxID=2909707 RepID=UPI003A88F66F